jgi:Cytochrome b(N-terminal)/b6/petB
VASWAYVFGVAAIAALGVAIASGFALALGGPDWWHYNPVGHFCNSLHLWSVELFMALLVIHLWAKFWMAAWRGRRAMTWITGVVAFVASVMECFTGYLSQQNFDSQWISTSGKDAFNSVGVGAFFNVMNFGQMLMWHIVLIPIILVAVVGAHVLMVRVRGVAPDRRRSSGARPHAIAPAGGRGRRRRRMARPDPPLRHPEGGHDRVGDHPRAHLHPGRRALLAGRAAGHHRDLGPSRARLPRHCGQRAERNQRDRQLRPAVQQPERQRAATAVLAADLAGHHPAGQRGPRPMGPSRTHLRAEASRNGHRTGDREIIAPGAGPLYPRGTHDPVNADLRP